MANKVSSLGIALTRIACPICGEQRPGDILMNKCLSPSEARKVESYDGKVIRFEPCPTCQAHLNDGVHFLIEADPDKSGLAPGDERALPQNVHRTGRYWGITREAAIRIFGENVEQVSFISPDVAEQIGLNDPQDDAPPST